MSYRRYRGRHIARRRHRRDPVDDEALWESLAIIATATLRGIRRLFHWLTSLLRRRPAIPPPPPHEQSPSNHPHTIGANDPPPPGEDAATAIARIAARLPYRGTRCVLTKGERAFWHPLRLAVADRYLIFAKVRLADLAATPDHRRDSARRFRDLVPFHVDFVLCDWDTTEPLLAIELDDRSHATPRGRKRDHFKDAVLQAAGLPVYRVRCQAAYSPEELAGEIERWLLTKGRRAAGLGCRAISYKALAQLRYATASQDRVI